LYGKGVINPQISISGITSLVRIAPPVTAKSTEFMASSIEIMEISDIPAAVFRAKLNCICRLRIRVSRAIEVSKPLKIASPIMNNGFHKI
jgi:hypothetical protein